MGVLGGPHARGGRMGGKVCAWELVESTRSCLGSDSERPAGIRSSGPENLVASRAVGPPLLQEGTGSACLFLTSLAWKPLGLVFESLDPQGTEECSQGRGREGQGDLGEARRSLGSGHGAPLGPWQWQ